MKLSKKTKWISLILGITLLAIGLVFPVGTVFGIRTSEEASYRVLREQGQIELREYNELVVVETSVDADYEQAGRAAFSRLFGYISGENTAATKIAMTAPVIADEGSTTDGEKINMTAPVLGEKQSTGWRYAFVLPASYTMDSAPAPSNPQVGLAVIPKKKVAVIRYAGSWNEQIMREQSEALTDWIQTNGLEPASQPRSARYDPPWTIPFLRRNEVMIDVR